jgi:hypothetical protein
MGGIAFRSTTRRTQNSISITTVGIGYLENNLIIQFVVIVTAAELKASTQHLVRDHVGIECA